MAELRKLVEQRKEQLIREKEAKAKKTAPKPAAPAQAALEPKSNTPDLVMMLKPYLQSVQSGTSFLTEVSLYSEKNQTYDNLRIGISYPHLNVRPLKVFDYMLKEDLDPKQPPEIRTETGLLLYSAKLKGPVTSLGRKPLLKIVWEATGDNPQAHLDLNNPVLQKGKRSSISLKERNLLESKSTESSACVNSVVAISNLGGGNKKILEPRKKGPLDFSKSRTAANALAEPKVRLAIRPSAKQPASRGHFLLDVLVDNPHYLAFDDVRLAIGFDPAKAEVLDWDHGGWIRRGVNVFDGHAHGAFPFNTHTRNDVQNRKGRINYQMGSTTLASRPSGCLVRIHCRALSKGALESFTLFPAGQDEQWFTDIRAKGRSVLGNPFLLSRAAGAYVFSAP